MKDLPKGWVATTLGEVLPVHYGKSLAKAERAEGNVEVYGSSGVIGFHQEPLTARPALIIARKGSVGSVYLSDGPCWPIDTVYYVEQAPSTNLIFARYLLEHINLARLDRSTAVPGLSREDYEKVQFNLPPLSEQRRIAAEIEKQLTRVETASNSIVGAQRRIKKYLDAALPLFCFLPHELSQDGLSALPHEGIWARVGELGEVKLGRQRSPVNHNGPHMRPYLRVANVFDDRIDTRSVHEMNFSPQEYELFRLEPGDILLNEGQSLELVGRAAIYAGEVPGACFQNTLVRYRPDARLRPQFALLVFRAYLRTGRFQRIAKWTTNIAHLGASRFAEMHFPLPPLSMQDEIIELAQRDLTLLSNLTRQLQVAAKRANRLRHAILARAFSGQLVPQCANDEPASELLAQIRREREASRDTAVSKRILARRQLAAQL